MRIRLIHWMFLHHILIPFKNTLWATPLFFLWWKSFTAMYIEHPYCYWYTSIFYLGMLSINIEIVGHPSIYLLLLFLCWTHCYKSHQYWTFDCFDIIQKSDNYFLGYFYHFWWECFRRAIFHCLLQSRVTIRPTPLVCIIIFSSCFFVMVILQQ